MTIKQALSKAETRLNNHQFSQLESASLLCSVINQEKTYLYAYPNKTLTIRQTKKYFELIEQRQKDIPLAYLLGYKYFYKLKFFVSKKVLIPRPESELLVAEALKISRADKGIKKIVDIGTGSGAIIIALAKNLKNKNYFAIDSIKPALKIAKQNAQFHKVKINFIQNSLLKPLKGRKTDLIVANLPYLSKKEYYNSPDYQQIKHEPKTALTDNSDGLTYFKQFFNQLSEFSALKNSLKYILLEISYDQADKLKAMTKKIYPTAKITIQKDLCGFDRLLIIKTKNYRF